MIDVLIELAWKSAVVAGLGLGGMGLLRRHAARDRVQMGSVALALLAALPLVVLLMPRLTVEGPAPTSLAAEMLSGSLGTAEAEAEIVPLDNRAWQTFDTIETGAASMPGDPWTGDDAAATPAPAEAAAPIDWEGILLLAYALPASGLLLYLLFGLAGLEGWARRAEPVRHPRWHAKLKAARARVGLKRPVRLLRSDIPTAPISFGVFRPAIMLDKDGLAGLEDADAVLAHEAAHLKNGDWPILLLSRAVRALFWFNPLVWLLVRQIDDRLEEAADELAIKGMTRTAYAQALLNAARREYAPYPVNAATASKLERRIVRLLGGETGPRSAARMSLAALLCAGVALPVAALQFAEAVEDAAPIDDFTEADVAHSDLEEPWQPDFALDEVEVPATAPHFDVAHEEQIGSDRDEMGSLGRKLAAARLAGDDALADRLEQRIEDAAERQMELAEAEQERAVERAEREAERAEAQAEREMERAERAAERAEERSHREAWAQASRAAAAGARSAAQTRGEAYARASADADDLAQIAMANSRDAMASADAEMRKAFAEAEAVRARELAKAMREMRRNLDKGADKMMRGADDMERGADKMEADANKLRDPSYRQEVIARQARHGDPVTEQELLDAIPELMRGAAEMREGAKDMRRGAQEMRAEARTAG